MSLQDIHGFDYFEAVADAKAQRRIHIGNEGYRAAACAFTNSHHRLGKFDGIIQRLHERTAAGFDIEQDAVAACSELLAHDGRSNQGDTVNRCRHIAQGIEFLVGRRKIAGLANQADTAFIDRIEEFLAVKRRLVAGDGFELIHRTAGMTKAAAAHLGHLAAAGCDNRADNQGRLIADAARGMLVNLLASNCGEVNHIAGFCHHHRQLGDFMVRHAVEPNRHQHRGHLVVRDFALDIAINHELDFFIRQNLTVFFLGNQVVHSHKKQPLF